MSASPKLTQKTSNSVVDDGQVKQKQPVDDGLPKAVIATNGSAVITTHAEAKSPAESPSPSPNNQQNNSSEPNSALDQLLAKGLDVRLVNRLTKLFSSTKLTLADLDDRAVEALKEFGNIDGAISVLNEFEESKLEHVTNKSAFLCGLMKTHRQKKKETFNSKDSVKSESLGTQPGPDEAKLKAILERTGYSLDITSGQRKYGGPPPDWTERVPGAGCEIFVGKIPKEIFEDDLVPLFEECGRIWDLRLMVDPLNGFNRGYAFITYCTRDDAFNAQQKFDGYEIRKGKTLKVNISVPNLRLFVGNIPKSKSREEIFQEFSKLTTGLTEVIVYTSPDDRKKNRGFCFLEYDSHKSASLAKRKLSAPRSKVWACDILVDWADPQEEPDQETMSKVKVLYIRNLMAEVTEIELNELFSRHGRVERVKKIKDYAFVHYDDRDHAVVALKELDGHEVHGVKISVSLAKPPSDRKKKEEVLRNRERRVSMMMQSRTGSIVAGMHRAPLLPPLPPPMPPPMAPMPPMGRGGRSRQGSLAGPYGQRQSLTPSSYESYWSEMKSQSKKPFVEESSYPSGGDSFYMQAYYCRDELGRPLYGYPMTQYYGYGLGVPTGLGTTMDLVQPGGLVPVAVEIPDLRSQVPMPAAGQHHHPTAMGPEVPYHPSQAVATSSSNTTTTVHQGRFGSLMAPQMDQLDPVAAHHRSSGASHHQQLLHYHQHHSHRRQLDKGLRQQQRTPLRLKREMDILQYGDSKTDYILLPSNDFGSPALSETTHRWPQCPRNRSQDDISCTPWN
ncbi:Heterogeneous nuclear ribonucleoprotein Q [Halotydeus destructor]|nr:Heterogeneous nuclear ribonucleoprotein Q [Halotydeus destructor]